MSISAAEYLVHLSNVLLLIAYSVRDILWLRWFAVAAAAINIPYYLGQPHILWPPVFWGIVFMVINLFQIARIYWERRPVVLSPDEQTLYDMGFRELRPREFVSLLLAGEWRTANAGDAIVRQGRARIEDLRRRFGRGQREAAGARPGVPRAWTCHRHCAGAGRRPLADRCDLHRSGALHLLAGRELACIP